MKNSKKGFTVVELVVVIAVLALLIAVLIPTFSSLIAKANLSKDTQLCRILNEDIAMGVQDEKLQKKATFNDVVEYLAPRYVLQNLTPRSNGDIVWDKNTNTFSLINNGEFVYVGDKATKNNYNANGVNLNLWKVVSSIPAASEQNYSMYLKQNANVETANIVVGFDAGANASVQTVNYDRTLTDDTDVRNVIIRTNGGTLTINAPTDTVKHYGEANVVDVQQINTTSYHENGKATFVKITSGRVVVEKEAEVGGLHIKANTAVVAVEATKELPTVTFESEVTTFKVQTTNAVGEKQTESTVTIGTGVEVSDGEGAVSTAIQEKLETANKEDKVATEAEAGEKAAEAVPPVGIARIGTKGYTNIDDAVNDLQNGQTLVLLSNIDRNSKLTITSGTKTLDLNGYVFSALLSNQSAIVVSENTVLNIVDNSEAKTGQIVARRDSRAVYAITVKGTVNIYSGDIYGYSNAIYTNTTGAVTNIYGGTFSADSTSPIYVQNATLNMTNGLVDASKNSYGIYLYDNAIVNVSGGEIVANASSTKATFRVSNNCSLEIGGSIAVRANRLIEFTNTGATNVSITGGTFNTSIQIHKGGDYSDNRDKATFNISGGTFNMEPSIAGFKNTSTIGTVTDNGNGTWTVTTV